MAIQLDIVTPEARLLSRRVDEVRAPGADGGFGVLPGHTSFITVMEPGALSFTSGGEEEHFFVGGGFVEVNEDQVIVLAESAEPVESIDVDRAELALRQAKERLEVLRQDEEAAAVERARVKRAAARIHLARGR